MNFQLKFLKKAGAVMLGLALVILFSGDVYAAEKRIEINTGIQRLYAFEGEELIYDFVVSTGKKPWGTPHGTYYPWIKLRYDDMTGGTPGTTTYYDLPNVPWVVYFYNEHQPRWKGYAIHGTYWHNNFGTPMSHGCINLKIPDARKIYNWIDFNTKIVVY